MDMKEASAMTEASGLVDQQDGRAMSQSEAPTPTHPRRPVPRMSDRLRRITVAAPLSSLFIAFLLGMMVARRR